MQYGGYDRTPRDTYLTSCWQSGQVVADGYTVPVQPDAPPGLYNLHVGLYAQQDNQISPLSLIEAGQSTDVTSVPIGPILIGGLPPGLTGPSSQPGKYC